MVPFHLKRNIFFEVLAFMILFLGFHVPDFILVDKVFNNALKSSLLRYKMMWVHSLGMDVLLTLELSK